MVVFDVDGTLIDSAESIFACLCATFDVLGRPRLPRAEALAVVGLSLPEAFARLLPGAGAGEVAAAVAAYRAAFLDLRAAGRAEDAAPLFPGARTLLDALLAAPGLVLGVATGKARRGLDHALALHGLEGHFATLQTADDHPSKPHPSMLRQALAETGVPPGQAVMVGDTSFDMEMGRAAGLRSVGVAWGHHSDAVLTAAGADVVVADFAALGGLLADWRVAAP
ncbi:MAG: HAD family hydrolase [Alphaproteobacteria bacterium HGW-Alphaproteobacteria-2]|nr:MAG: HAD family hydrolase [Alphaproteobacteria bacterium HGW-Alphaproteobacteria-2]